MTPRQSALFALVLWSSAIATADPRPAVGKESAPPGVDVVKTSSDEIEMHTRLLVRQIAPRDRVRLMTHWRGRKEEFDPGKPGPAVHLTNTLASMTFIITTPDGKAHTLTAEISDQRHEHMRAAHALYSNATHAFVLDSAGLEVTSDQFGGVTGKWKEKSPPAFDAEGEYTIRLKGTIAGPDATFETGQLKLTVSRDTQPIKDAFTAAPTAIKLALPAAKIAKSGQTESGYVQGLVYENEQDQRVLHFNGNLSKVEWGYDLLRVTLSRKGGVIEVAHRTVHTCVAAGMMVATPGGPKRIESLRVGDEVWSYDAGKRVKVRSTVRGIRTGEAEEIITVGDELRVTANHPVYASGGWMRAGDLIAGHKLLAFDGSEIKLAATPVVATLSKATLVYDLTVDEPHNYFAGGLLVHNKNRGWYAGLDDPWHFYWPRKPHEWTVAFKETKE